jgi:hypothetical protein
LGGYPGLIREYRQSVERRKREKKEETTGSMPGGEVEGWKDPLPATLVVKDKMK